MAGLLSRFRSTESKHSCSIESIPLIAMYTHPVSLLGSVNLLYPPLLKAMKDKQTLWNWSHISGRIYAAGY